MNRIQFFILALTLGIACSCKSPKEASYPDRDIYELKGNVKEVKVVVCGTGTEEVEYTLKFKKNGLCTRHKNDNLWKSKNIESSTTRDANSRITVHNIKDKKGKDAKMETKYTYDKDGKVTNTSSMWYGKTVITEKYEYNADGRLIRIERNILDFNSPTKETIHFRNPKHDAMDNWIEREGLKINENGQDGTISKSTFTEKREITYY
ncbi:MAG: hypothetical protein J6Q73_00535 [Bacteroidaceae bacterium]|nr:hypothetical protein [Bacteroidaceae bacterium]